MASEERKTFSSIKEEELTEPLPHTTDHADGNNKAIVETRKAFGNNRSSQDSDEEDEPSQVTLSQTDEQIRQLESDGALNQVVGSQSMLSQELLCASQPEPDEDEEEEDEEGKFSQSQFQCSQQQFQFSQQTETSISMAQRFGLLTQEDQPREIDTEEDFGNSQISVLSHPPVRPGVASSDGSSSPPSSTVAASSTPGAKPAVLRDTPIRESECFGSLLDAVQAITEQEEVCAKLYALQHTDSTVKVKVEDDADDSPTNVKGEKTSKRKAPPKASSATSQSPVPSPKKQRKSTAKKNKEAEQRNAQEIAKRAAALAKQTVEDKDLAKQLLLSMALVRENPRTLPTTWPPRGSIVPEGFFWARWPPLESVLKKHMAEYYELSTTKCQSAQQQAFNNDLVVEVREVSKQQGWKFNKTFSDKSLRDRIRCYYKTHIQNAKKRLRTMVRNPTKKANARHLCSHLDLIEKYKAQGQDGGENSVKVRIEDSESPAKATDKPIKEEPAPSPVASIKTRRKTASPVKERRKPTPEQSFVEV